MSEARLEDAASQYLEYLKITKAATRRLRGAYRAALRDMVEYFGPDHSVRLITKKAMGHFKEHLYFNDMTPSEVNNRLFLYRKFFEWMVRRRLRATDIMPKVQNMRTRNQNATHAHTWPELLRLVRGMRHPYLRGVIVFFIRAKIKPQWLRPIRVGDVDFNLHTLDVMTSAEEVRIPLTEKALLVARRYAGGRERDELLFPSRRTGGLIKNMDTALTTASRRAGLRPRASLTSIYRSIRKLRSATMREPERKVYERE